MLHTEEQQKSIWSDNRYKSRAHVSYESTSNINAYNHRGLKLYILFYLLIKQLNVVKKEEN